MFLQIVQNLSAVVIGYDFFAGCQRPCLCKIVQNTLCPEKDPGGSDCFQSLLCPCRLCADTDADQGEDSCSLPAHAGILQCFRKGVFQPVNRGSSRMRDLAFVNRSRPCRPACLHK